MNVSIKSFIKSYIRSLKYIWEISKVYVLLNAALIILQSFMNVFSLLIIKWILDILVRRSSYKILIVVLAINFSLKAFYTISSSWFNNKMMPKLKQKIRFKLSQDIFKEMYKKSIDETQKSGFYDEYYFILENSEDSLLSSFTMGLSIFGTISTLLGIITVIINYDFILILLSLCGAIVTLYTNFRISKISHDYNYDLTKEEREYSYVGRVFYLKDYIKEIKVYNLVNILFDKLKDANCKIINKIDFYAYKLMKYNIFQGLNLNLIDIFAIGYLGYKLVFGLIFIGDFMMMYNGVNSLLSQMNMFFIYLPALYEKTLYTNHFFGFFEDNKDKCYKIQLEKINKIVFSHVDFRYSGQSSFGLSDINIELYAKEKIAVIGENGSGKSTLLHLLCNLYAPSGGNIYINDYNLAELLPQDYWNKIFIMFQDYQLYSFSIFENILLKKNNSLQQDIELVNNALKFVGLYDKVSKLPQGIYSVLTNEFDDNGVTFSGGEFQKIALARAYVKNYDVFIFDEPTSALDNISSIEINKLIDIITRDKIVMYVTHRINQLRKCDRILLMESGKIIEEGTHDQLIKSSFKYQRIFNAKCDD